MKRCGRKSECLNPLKDDSNYLPESEFCKDLQRKDGLYHSCKVCEKERKRPDDYIIKKRNNHYLKAYKITLEEYERLFEEQKGLCAICNKPESHPIRKHLSVDHCHETGKIRGLLCNKCNRNIGFLGDSKETFEKILKYLK